MQCNILTCLHSQHILQDGSAYFQTSMEGTHSRSWLLQTHTPPHCRLEEALVSQPQQKNQLNLLQLICNIISWQLFSWMKLQHVTNGIHT